MTYQDILEILADDNELDVKILHNDQRIETIKRKSYFPYCNHKIARIEAGATPKTITVWIFEDKEKIVKMNY